MKDIDRQSTQAGKTIGNLGLTLLLLVQILPFLGISYLLNNKLNTEAQFIARQKTGFDYLGTLHNLLMHIQQHRGIANVYLNGVDELKSRLSQIAAQIDKDMLAIEGLHRASESIEQGNDEWVNWRMEWLKLQQQHLQMSATDNFRAHNILIEELLLFTQSIVNDFSLMLYVQLDSRALAEAVMQIPWLIDDLGQLRGLGTGIVARGNISANEKVMLMALGQSASVRMDDLVKNMDVLFQKNAPLKLRLSAKVSEAVNSASHFLDTVYKQITQLVVLDMPTGAYFSTTSPALSDFSSLLTAIANELNNHITIRMKDVQHKRLLLQGSTLFILLVSMVIFFMFLRHQTVRQRLWSKLQQSMAALTRSKQKTQAIIENAADSIIVINENGIIDSFSASAEHMFGYSATEIIGKNINRLMPEPYRSHHENYLQRYMETGDGHIIGTGHREVIALRCDGTTFPAELAVSEVLMEGQNRLFIGLLRDITRRKEAENELRASEERFALITRGTRDGIWDWDLTTGQIYFSPRWKTMLFYDEAEIEHNFMALQNLIHPDDLGLALEGWMACLDGETDDFSIEYRLLNKHDSYTWIRCRGMAIHDESGQPTRMAGSHSDISTQKQAFVVMEHMNQELQAKTEELLHSNQELDQFAYIASHDLKAPLRAIANLSQWVEEDLEEVMTDDTRKQMALLRSRVQRMEGLINGVLQYSRVGRIDMEIEEVNVVQLLDEILDGLSPPPGFQIEIAENMPVLQTARVPLSQVFGNLLSNAIKYHHQPESAKVSILVRQPDATTYQFSVTDDGPGIAPEYHEKVFQIFQTLNARDKVESTGVGLTVVKKIVEQMGGEIRLDSAEGQGSTFSFTLPIYKNEDTQET